MVMFIGQPFLDNVQDLTFIFLNWPNKPLEMRQTAQFELGKVGKTFYRASAKPLAFREQ